MRLLVLCFVDRKVQAFAIDNQIDALIRIACLLSSIFKRF